MLERRGRLVVVPSDGGPPVWRSARRAYDRPGGAPWVTGLAVSPERVAVSVFGRAGGEAASRLLVAARDGAEREVPGATGEAPVGWTAVGHLVTREGRARLRLRGADGGFLSEFPRGARSSDWDPASRSAVVVGRGAVRRVGSGGDVVLADLVDGEALGPNVEVATGGRIVLVGRRALVVLRPDGTLWARGDYPRGGEIAGQGSLTTSPDGRTIAFANVRYRAGVVSVELLREGERRSRRLLRRDFAVRPPGWSTGLSWRGPWLLSWTSDGAVAALHPKRGRRIELPVVGRSWPGGHRPAASTPAGAGEDQPQAPPPSRSAVNPAPQPFDR